MKKYTIDQAFEKIGGYNRYHLFVSILLIVAFASGGSVFLSTSFLELAPAFECSDYPDFRSVFECQAQSKNESVRTFCFAKEPIYHRVNESAPTSLQNWYTQLNLACVSKSTMAFIGMSFFLGWTVSASFIPRLSDKYGRKIIFLGTMVL